MEAQPGVLQKSPTVAGRNFRGMHMPSLDCFNSSKVNVCHLKIFGAREPFVMRKFRLRQTDMIVYAPSPVKHMH